MLLKNIQLKNFRCFSDYNLDINSKILLIEGDNGIGKTSLLEALHYLCYLKSFRTRITSDLINSESDNFFIKIKTEDSQFIPAQIQAGFSKEKRSIKFNQKSLASHKDLIDIFKVVSLTEDDINLIKGYPKDRRTFLDHFILINNPQYAHKLRLYNRVVDNKRAALTKNNIDLSVIDGWNKQIWKLSSVIRQERLNFLQILKASVADLAEKYFGQKLIIKFKYILKNEKDKNFENYEDYKKENLEELEKEIKTQKLILGSHFDDFLIFINGKNARVFGSRGQQKIIVVLAKIAQLLKINSQESTTLFLLDDFMTDFDNEKIKKIIEILDTLNCQIIFTCPLEESFLKEELVKKGAQVVKIK